MQTIIRFLLKANQWIGFATMITFSFLFGKFYQLKEDFFPLIAGFFALKYLLLALSLSMSMPYKKDDKKGWRRFYIFSSFTFIVLTSIWIIFYGPVFTNDYKFVETERNFHFSWWNLFLIISISLFVTIVDIFKNKLVPGESD